MSLQLGTTSKLYLTEHAEESGHPHMVVLEVVLEALLSQLPLVTVGAVVGVDTPVLVHVVLVALVGLEAAAALVAGEGGLLGL